jgi:hypothetical protein
MANIEQISSPVARARCRAVLSLAAFVESVDPSVETNVDAFWTCSEPFTTLTHSRFLPDLVAWELDCLRTDPDYVPSPGADRDFEVFRLGHLVLSVHVHTPDPDPPSSLLYGFCEHSLSINAGPGSILIERWTQEWEGPPEILDRTRGLAPLPLLIVGREERVQFRAHHDVVRIGARDAAAVVVTLSRMQATRVRWVYDARTLMPVRAEAADSSTARLEYAMALLAALDHTEAAPVIAGLYDHPDHFVRWSAVRRVTELDPSLGAQLVQRALQDAHPHVRRAAQRSLDRSAAARTKDTIHERNRHGAHA